MWNSMFWLVIIISLSKYSVQSPVDPVNQVSQVTMYEALLQKCPNIAKTSIVNHTEIKNCIDWPNIETTKVFSQETLPNLRCLLYYDSLVSFCTKAGELLAISPRVVDDEVMILPKNFSVAKICESANKLFNTGEHELSKFVSTNDCFELCLDIGHKTGTSIDPYCAKAFYFVTFKVDDFKSNIQEIAYPKNNNQDVPLDNQNSNKAPKVEQLENQQSIAAPKDTKTPKSFENKPEDINIETPNIKSKGTMSNINTANNPDPAVSQQKKESEKTIPNMVDKPEPNPPAVIIPAEEVIPSEVKKTSTPLPKEKITPAKSDGVQKVKIDETQPDQQQAPLIDSKNQNAKEKVAENTNDDVKNDKVAGNAGEDIDTSVGEDAAYEDPDDSFKFNNGKSSGVGSFAKTKPDALEEGVIVTPEEITDGDSSFFPYFLATMFLCIIGYVGYHNRQKLLALVLEGRQRGGRRHQRGGRRPNAANYHKLDTNLEEALSSSAKKSASNVIF